MNGDYDAMQFTPMIRGMVTLTNGEIIWANYVMGDWETSEGEVIYPLKFSDLVIVVNSAKKINPDKPLLRIIGHKRNVH